MVYPGSMHTRFEHSLGVMHAATMMYDHIVRRCREFLEEALGFNEHGIARDRVLIRFACLLHDIGHSPFSHAGEGLMATKPGQSTTYKHEDYSVAAVKYLLKDAIENNPMNENYHITAEEVADFIDGNPKIGRRLLWRNLLSGQIDADRADYLLRDSHHIGVTYGHYDLNRLLVTMTVGRDDTGAPTIAVDESGIHAAEGLIIARYMMFSQVYFHHTRRIYDYHIGKVINQLLIDSQTDLPEGERGKFPPPDSQENVERYMNWNDWRVLGLIDGGKGGEHAGVIAQRAHLRCVYSTIETPTEADIDKVNAVSERLGGMVQHIDAGYETKMYKLDSDIPIKVSLKNGGHQLYPLSDFSTVVKNLNPIGSARIYVKQEDKEAAKAALAGLDDVHTNTSLRDTKEQGGNK